jgi:hypothetical protein
MALNVHAHVVTASGVSCLAISAVFIAVLQYVTYKDEHSDRAPIDGYFHAYLAAQGALALATSRRLSAAWYESEPGASASATRVQAAAATSIAGSIYLMVTAGNKSTMAMLANAAVLSAWLLADLRAQQSLCALSAALAAVVAFVYAYPLVALLLARHTVVRLLAELGLVIAVHHFAPNLDLGCTRHPAWRWLLTALARVRAPAACGALATKQADPSPTTKKKKQAAAAAAEDVDPCETPAVASTPRPSSPDKKK